MAQIATQEPPEETAAPPPPKPKRSPVTTALLVVLVVGPSTLGVLWVMNLRAEREQRLLAEWDPPLEEVTFPLRIQTVNLADGDRYARCQVVPAFELDPVDAAYFRQAVAARSESGEADNSGDAEEGQPLKAPKKEPGKAVKKLLRGLSNNEVQLNDAVLRELGSRKFGDMLREADKARVREALKKRFNAILCDSPETAPAGAADNRGSGREMPDGEPEQEDIRVSAIYFSEFVMQ